MRAYKIIKLFAIIILLYDILPGIYYRYCSHSVRRRFSNSNSIFLTFDDGPNPIYTVEILNLLKKYNVKATFFVIAKKAEENKDIINRIIDEGHTLGIHSYEHKFAWLCTPWQTKRDFQNSILVFKEFDYNIKYFRSPWGIYNLFTHYYSNKGGLKSILWTKIINDWRLSSTVDEIISKAVDNRKGGDIIVLHDSRHDNNGIQIPPQNTIEALNTIIPTLIDKGFDFKTIEEGMDI